MQVSIDSSGRVVVPKTVRERLRLRAGALLHLEETEKGFFLRVADDEPSLIHENGVWVHTGKLPAGVNWERLVDEDREDRIRKIAGL